MVLEDWCRNPDLLMDEDHQPARREDSSPIGGSEPACHASRVCFVRDLYSDD